MADNVFDSLIDGLINQAAAVFDDLTWRKEVDQLKAIDVYIRSQRKKVEQFPALLPLIESWEGWIQSLGIIDLSPLRMGDTIAEAKRRRTEVNNAMGEKLPDDFIPADGPQTPPAKTDSDPVRTALVLAGTIGVGYLLLKLFS